jgi:hypothetical protein
MVTHPHTEPLPSSPAPTTAGMPASSHLLDADGVSTADIAPSIAEPAGARCLGDTSLLQRHVARIRALGWTRQLSVTLWTYDGTLCGSKFIVYLEGHSSFSGSWGEVESFVRSAVRGRSK